MLRSIATMPVGDTFGAALQSRPDYHLARRGAGIPVEPATKRREAGILAVRRALRERRLLVCADCARTIYEFQHYRYAEWSDAGRNAKERPVDADDHMLEALYRLVLLESRHQERRSRPIKAYAWCP